MQTAPGAPTDVYATVDVIVAELLDDPNLLLWLDASEDSTDGPGFAERLLDRELAGAGAPRGLVIQAVREVMEALNTTRGLVDVQP